MSEYVATTSIRDQYATAAQGDRRGTRRAAREHRRLGLGLLRVGQEFVRQEPRLCPQEPQVLGEDFARLFKRQLDDERVDNLLDLINAKIPTEVILFEVAKEKDTRRVTERIAELMYAVLLRELGYAEDLDIAELEIELEAEGRLQDFIELCQTLHKRDWTDRPVGCPAGRTCQRHPAPPRPGDLSLGRFVVALPP